MLRKSGGGEVSVAGVLLRNVLKQRCGRSVPCCSRNLVIREDIWSGRECARIIWRWAERTGEIGLTLGDWITEPLRKHTSPACAGYSILGELGVRNVNHVRHIAAAISC